jgi:hypothetical protein
MQRNSKPLAWRAKTLSDTEDASSTETGAMGSLQNLVPDPVSKLLWYCRPAATLITNLNSTANAAAFLAAYGAPLYLASGFISVFKIIGDVVYGMVAGGKGFDLPFTFNLQTSILTLPTGVTAINVPNSPTTSGAWTPPTMDLIGSKLIVTHPGFSGGNGYFGWFDVSNPSLPTWASGNLTGLISFTTPPSAVAQFGNRAYYITNLPSQPSVVFSDVLNALNVTNANQALTFNDNQTLTALGGLALFNQLGGIIQSLMVFKGNTNIYQITGDAATSNLTVNTLNITTGTLAPWSIAPTPKGLAFMAPDGLRLIDFDARISDPIGMDGNGITSPFTLSVVPSRVSATCNGSVYRITTQNGAQAGTPTQEFWYDFSRQTWSGPHTSTQIRAQPWRGTFIIAPTWQNNSLLMSDPIQSLTSNFVENGSNLIWLWQTPLLPDTDEITNNAMTEATLDLAFSAGGTATIRVSDQNSSVIDTVMLTAPGTPTVWGGFSWGTGVWGGASTQLAPRQLQWHFPIVFARMSLQATGSSTQALRVGALHMRYQQLRTWANINAAA